MFGLSLFHFRSHEAIHSSELTVLIIGRSLGRFLKCLQLFTNMHNMSHFLARFGNFSTVRLATTPSYDSKTPTTFEFSCRWCTWNFCHHFPLARHISHNRTNTKNRFTSFVQRHVILRKFIFFENVLTMLRSFAS